MKFITTSLNSFGLTTMVNSSIVMTESRLKLAFLRALEEKDFIQNSEHKENILILLTPMSSVQNLEL